MDKLGWDAARSRTKLRWNWSAGVSNPVKGWAADSQKRHAPSRGDAAHLYPDDCHRRQLLMTTTTTAKKGTKETCQ